jgi:hypothetical protein
MAHELQFNDKEKFHSAPKKDAQSEQPHVFDHLHSEAGSAAPPGMK